MVKNISSKIGCRCSTPAPSLSSYNHKQVIFCASVASSVKQVIILTIYPKKFLSPLHHCLCVCVHKYRIFKGSRHTICAQKDANKKCKIHRYYTEVLGIISFFPKSTYLIYLLNTNRDICKFSGKKKKVKVQGKKKLD